MVSQPAEPEDTQPVHEIDDRDRQALYARLHSDADPPPWSIPDLTPGEAHALFADLARWVDDYNAHVQMRDQMIPPCWPLHGSLVQAINALYWQWWEATSPGAHADAMVTYVLRWLREFAAALPDYLAGTEASCREGKHTPRPARAEALLYREELQGRTTDAIRQVVADLDERPLPRHDEIDPLASESDAATTQPVPPEVGAW